MKTASSIDGGAHAPGANPAAAPTDGGPRARPPGLRSNFWWTLAGNVVFAGSQWIILVAIAQLASTDAVGRFALGLAVTTPVFLFTGLHLRASQATDAARAFDFADYFRVRLGGTIVALVVTAAIVSLSEFDRATGLVVLAVGASKAAEAFSDVYYGLLQQNERMRPMAVSLMWRGVLSAIAVGAVLWAGGGLFLALVALGASWVAVLLVHDRRAANRLLPASAPRRRFGRPAGRLVALCFPLGLVMMLVALRTNIPRYFLQGSTGPAELGVFAALSSLLTAGNVVVSALGQSASPRLARHYHERDLRAFRRLLARLLVIAVVIGSVGLAVAIVGGEPLLRLVFGSEYARRSDVLVVLMAIGLVTYAASFLGYGLMATRRFTVQLPLFAALTLVCGAACVWLVPAYGVSGAAYGWGASMVVELVAIWVVLELTLRRHAAGGAR